MPPRSFSPAPLRPVFAALLLLATAPVIAAAETPPPASELVSRVVAADAAARARRLDLEYDFVLTTERLDASGKVIKTKTTRAVARPSRQVEFATEITPDANATAQERERSATEARESQRLQAAMNLQRLAPHFDYSIEGGAVLDGRDCWVLAYRPKPGSPAASREERIIHQLQGRFWVEKTTAAIVQSEGSLAAPVNLAFIASMNRLDFRYRSQPLPGGELVPASFQIEVNVTAPFYYFDQRQSSAQSNYRPRSK